MKISKELFEQILHQVEEDMGIEIKIGSVQQLIAERIVELVIENQLGESVQWVTQNELVHPTQR